jgi:hypothetical protein
MAALPGFIPRSLPSSITGENMIIPDFTGCPPAVTRPLTGAVAYSPPPQPANIERKRTEQTMMYRMGDSISAVLKKESTPLRLCMRSKKLTQRREGAKEKEGGASVPQKLGIGFPSCRFPKFS